METLVGALIALFFLTLWLGIIFLLGLMWWKIFRKAGYHGALGLLMLVPIANLIMLAILAFRDWPIHGQLKEGPVSAPKPLAPAAIIAIVIAVAILPMSLLAAIAIPNLLRARLMANQSAAKAKVITISTAIETYASANQGRYPLDEYELLHADPPYLSGRYHNKDVQGYNYTLDLNAEGYVITAMPTSCGVTGNKIFRAKNSEGISEEDCKRLRE